jgi:photosystem II stability/assembly factor-like uncharacterized protein
LNVGSLAIDPGRPAVLYCGTGEANGTFDSYPGVGVYRSGNGGKTWQLLASAVAHRLPRRIGVIAIDPFDSNHIRIGGINRSESEPAAMFTSQDAGIKWRRENFISRKNYWCHAIVFHPTRRGTIFAAVEARGVKSGIWRSVDEGRNWIHLMHGLESPDLFGRTSLAIAPSDPDVIYAIVADRADRVLGVFRSQDVGDHWISCGLRHFHDEDQMDYGNCIVVHPTKPNHVLCGGMSLHRSINGGRTWTKVTNGYIPIGRAHYAHADHHALLMPAAHPGLVYDANDGGLDRSDNGGSS